MEPQYFDGPYPPEVDYQSYEAPPHIPFPYNSSGQVSSSVHHDFHPASNVDGSLEGPTHQQNPDYPAPLLRDAELPDPAARPRLTTEQTNILEAKFQADPKPPTDTKKEIAQNIGLPLDKVNNWYQNRRAKAKNAKKAETYGILPMPSATDRRMSSSSVTMPEDPMMRNLHSMWAPDMSNVAPMAGEPVYGGMGGSFANTMDAPASLPINPFDMSTLQVNCQAADAAEASFKNTLLMAEQQWDEENQHWDELLTDFAPHQMALQQSAPLSTVQYNASNPVLSSSGDYSSTFQSPTMTHQYALQGSPNSSCFAASPQYGAKENSSRRGSDTSELASNMNTIRLQRAQQQVVNEEFFEQPQLPTSNLASNMNTLELLRAQQQVVNEELFEQPQLPTSSLAARRKRVPGALGSLAKGRKSSTGSQATSPTPQTLAHRPAASVRRIKSTGNSLNVVNSGRIQKSGAASAQRSPMNVATFAEAEAMNSFNAFTAPSPSTSQGTDINGAVPMTPHTPAPAEHSAFNWTKPLGHSTSNPNMHQHQQFHSSPYTTHAASPHIQMPPPYMTDVYSIPNYSAPAHITHFPDFSPEVHAMTGPSASYFPVQAVRHQQYVYPQGPSYVATQMSPVPMYHCQPQLPSQPQPQFYNYYQPQIVANSPPPAYNPGYYPVQPTPPTRPAPVQELTWVAQTEFVAKSPPVKVAEAHQSKEWEFQHMGPQDF